MSPLHTYYRERFSKELEQAIHGTVRASPDEWGETLEGEQLRGGSFLEQDQIQVSYEVVCVVMWCDVLCCVVSFCIGNASFYSFFGSPYPLPHLILLFHFIIFLARIFLSLIFFLPTSLLSLDTFFFNPHSFVFFPLVWALATTSRTRSGQLQTPSLRRRSISPCYQRVHGKINRRFCIYSTATNLPYVQYFILLLFDLFLFFSSSHSFLSSLFFLSSRLL